jgi:hypothetical protein
MSSINIDQDFLEKNKYCIITNILSKDETNNILNKTISWSRRSQSSSRRRIEKIWCGASNLKGVNLLDYNHVQLEDGRIDVHLPKELGEKLVSIEKNKLLKFFPKNYKIAHYNMLILSPNKKKFKNGTAIDIWKT